MNLKELINGNGRLSEIIRFGLVGGLATGIQLGMYYVFAEAVGLTAVIATIISYGISFVFNFILSNFFTFHTRPNAKKGLGFIASHAINMGLQVGLVAVFNIFMPKSLAILPAMAICVPVNYFLVRIALTSKLTQSKKEKAAKTNQDKRPDNLRSPKH